MKTTISFESIVLGFFVGLCAGIFTFGLLNLIK